MPNKITLSDVLPSIWEALEIQTSETTRALNRKSFERIMKTTGTIVSPSVVRRMWETLRASDYASIVPLNSEVVMLDVQEIRRFLHIIGQARVITHTTHTDRPLIEEGAQ